MAKSKWFRVAVEGLTATDGRKIEKTWLTDIAATYNRATYGARVNMEHIRGFSPAPPFNAYGDVLEVRVQEDELQIGGKAEKRTCLYARIEPTDALVAITKDKQKIYTSIEVAPNFAGTNKAGLVGLAVTDGPASLGTDILEFSAGSDAAAAGIKAMLDGRKQDKANFFSAAYETAFELEADASQTVSLGDQLVGALKELFAKPDPKPPVIVAPPADAGAADLTKLTASIEAGFAKVAELTGAAMAGVEQKIDQLRADHDSLKGQLDSKENLSNPRPPVTGGGLAYEQTDC
ncbi:GPO family capsid scaffolding protein [Phenylobacterium sp.]|uniref:GPO family capsid scaffolding protein n=1 Tax=Phenylobacterium sp. TaxID=1871053 RepID=UPI00301DDFE2